MLTVVVVGSLAIGAAAVRRRLLPDWRGAPSLLATSVLAVAGAVGLGELLGALGLFSRWWLVAGAVAAGGAARLVGGGAGRAPAPELRPAAPAADRIAVLVTVAASAVVAAQWAQRIAVALRTGLYSGDTLTYHLPYAARFAQDHSIWHLVFPVPQSETAFHPANAELLHGSGILLFHRDVLSVVLNVGWLAFTVLAAYCIGRRFGKGPVCALAVLVALDIPLLVDSQPWGAMNDIVLVGLVLAAVALLVEGVDRPGAPGARAPLALAGLAAGLAVGTKLSAVAPVVALTVGIAVWAGRRDWRRALLTWGLPVVGAGLFWYLRNLILVGNPVPASHVGVGPVALPQPTLPLVEKYGFSVLHYASDPGVWRHYFVPGLKIAMGPAWPATLAVVAAASLLALWRGTEPVLRVAAAAVVVGAAAYLVTPTTAFGLPGKPILFAANLRYLTPCLALALALVPLVPVADRIERWVVAGLAALLLAEVAARGLLPGVLPQYRAAAVAVGAAALIGGIVVVTVHSRAATRPAALRALGMASAAVAVAAAVVIGFPLERVYLRNRYAHDLSPRGAAYRWARGVSHQRIAMAGFHSPYPLFGLDLTNTVRSLARTGAHGNEFPIATCIEWRAALRSGRYRFVVTSVPGDTQSAEPIEAGWTRAAPGVVEVLRDGGTAVFRLDQPPGDAGCPATQRPPDVVTG